MSVKLGFGDHYLSFANEFNEIQNKNVLERMAHIARSLTRVHR